ncbi:MAG: hypothetical protein MJB14_21900 [Spirochaetes bacterium]|nr:hypothetical protein [Spirochaetota bacterium]
MKKYNKILNLQTAAIYSLIFLSVILFVFSLGFMTQFYRLLRDGNNEMYQFFKDLQSLNNVLFTAAIWLLLLSILQIPINFKKMGINLGCLIFVIFFTIINLFNGIRVLLKNRYFKFQFLQIDFSSLENFSSSTFNFDLTMLLVLLAILLSLILLVISLIIFIKRPNWRERDG